MMCIDRTGFFCVEPSIQTQSSKSITLLLAEQSSQLFTHFFWNNFSPPTADGCDVHLAEPCEAVLQEWQMKTKASEITDLHSHSSAELHCNLTCALTLKRCTVASRGPRYLLNQIKTTDKRNYAHNGSQSSALDNSRVYKLIMKKPLGVSTLHCLKSLNTTCSRHLCCVKVPRVCETGPRERRTATGSS